jgi:hypothetical protein
VFNGPGNVYIRKQNITTSAAVFYFDYHSQYGLFLKFTEELKLSANAGDELLAQLDDVSYLSPQTRSLETGSIQLYRNGLNVYGVVNEVGKVIVNTWNEAVTAVDNIIITKTSQLNNLFPNAKIGYRGSLATGTKYSTGGGPFDPLDWDVDAFIVSDNLATQIGGSGFRNGRNVPSIATIADDLEVSFKNVSGYRTELNKPFTFRVFTEAEFNSIVKPNGYKLFQ